MNAQTAERLPRRALFGRGMADELMPWTDPARIFERCTGCGLCSTACPQGIVAKGAGGHPYLVFSNECTFCGACAAACEEEVFDLTRKPALAASARIGENCLEQRGVSCRACEDACPEAAIRARPQIGGTVRMDVDIETCTGCGACISLCPTQAVEVAPYD